MATVCTSKMLTDILAFFKTKIAAYIAAIETETGLAAGTIPALKDFETHDEEKLNFPYGVMYEMDASFVKDTLSKDQETVQVAIAILDQRAAVSESARILRAYRDAFIRIIEDFPTTSGTSYQLTLRSSTPALTMKVNANFKGIVRVVFDVEKYN